MRRRSFPHRGRILLAVLTVLLVRAPQADADVVITASGTSAAGRAIAVEATLAIVGDMLTIDLVNTSPVDSREAPDVLSSFYFDVVRGGTRPTLTYATATGQVYQVKSGAGNDVALVYHPQTFTPGIGTSDLRALKAGDASWQFLAMQPAATPFLGFGLGTVANAQLKPNGFTEAIVGPSGNSFINFAIYRGDADISPTGVLANKYLVRNRARFTFSGAGGFTDDDISRHAAFGFGTTPDSILMVPEPGGMSLAVAALVLIGGRWRRRRTTR